MTIRIAIAVIIGALLGASAASAQIGGSAPSPLGITSPLGIGPSVPVAPTGIPLGATELASPGVSPMTSGVTPLDPATGLATTCSAGTLSAGSGGSSTVFDGGGMTGTASGTCAAIASGPAGSPTASASSPTGMSSMSGVGRVGIPLGSTELGGGGLSPPPDILSPNPTVPSPTLGTTSPCTMTGTFSVSGMPAGSC